ncbi:phosphatidylinositol transfer protein alpha isoform-like [Asterias amurensis]|uniref:phosphatidylinositol transfer protein alpha isoform-like n=1 Tax=Asterias amurensis TaxID=7602 RepID=UPI003AB49E26
MRVLSLLLTLMVTVPQVTALINREFRTLLPYSLEQFRNGYLWSVAESSLYETGGGEGFEIVVNEPADEIKEGLPLPVKHYSHRILHLASKVPRWIRALAPKGSLEDTEESWDAFPYVLSVYTNPDYMKSGFYFKITTKYVDNDDCKLDNVFSDISGSSSVLTEQIDICRTRSFNEYWDPTQCSSEKLNIAPLTSGWQERSPHMCVYSFLEVYFEWWGLQTRAEKTLLESYREAVTKFHRQMFCWADQWAGVTLEEVRQKEEVVKQELDLLRNRGDVRGMVMH